MVRHQTVLLQGTKSEKAKHKQRENATNKSAAKRRRTKIVDYLTRKNMSRNEFALKAGISAHVMNDFMNAKTQTGSIAYDRCEIYMKFNK